MKEILGRVIEALPLSFSSIFSEPVSSIFHFTSVLCPWLAKSSIHVSVNC